MPVIAAQPYAYEFDAKASALLVIDMQRDFIEPGGFGAALGNDVSRLRAIVPAVRRLLDACRAARIPVIHTKEAHLADLADCPRSKLERGNPALRIGERGPMGRILIDGEPGSDFVDELKPITGEAVIVKPGKGAFFATELDARLRAARVRYLLLAGVTTEVCVQTTMREANDRGYDCLLVEDATESYFAQFKQATLAMVRAQGGIVGWTAPSAAVLQALAEA
jgi:biuret amidohydrolase